MPRITHMLEMGVSRPLYLISMWLVLKPLTIGTTMLRQFLIQD